MKPRKLSDRHATNLQTLRDLEVLKTAFIPNGWGRRLRTWTDRGYPTGGDNTGGSNTINRPTERYALAPRTHLEQLDTHAEAFELELAALARKYKAIYLEVTVTNKYDGPEPRPCIVLTCDKEISMIGSDIHRQGRCNRCDQWFRRHGTEYPTKPSKVVA